MATTITLSNISRTVFGNKRIVFADCTFGSTDYPAAGIALVASDFGISTIEFMKAERGTLIYKYDYTNGKLLAYTTITGGATNLLEVATDSDPTETIKLMVIGTGLS